MMWNKNQRRHLVCKAYQWSRNGMLLFMLCFGISCSGQPAAQKAKEADPIWVLTKRPDSVQVLGNQAGFTAFLELNWKGHVDEKDTVGPYRSTSRSQTLCHEYYVINFDGTKISSSVQIPNRNLASLRYLITLVFPFDNSFYFHTCANADESQRVHSFDGRNIYEEDRLVSEKVFQRIGLTPNEEDSDSVINRWTKTQQYDVLLRKTDSFLYWNDDVFEYGPDECEALFKWKNRSFGLFRKRTKEKAEIWLLEKGPDFRREHRLYSFDERQRKIRKSELDKELSQR